MVGPSAGTGPLRQLMNRRRARSARKGLHADIPLRPSEVRLSDPRMPFLPFAPRRSTRRASQM